MSDKMKFYLNANSGYIAIPRALAEYLIREVVIDDTTTLYSYLLLSANYAQTKTPAGVVKRGGLDSTIAQLAMETGRDYGRIRRLMKELEQEELVAYNNDNGHRYIFLPHYEEHCGHKVRPVEQADGTTALQSDSDRGFDLFWEFYHQMIPVPQTDREKARRMYGKLSRADRDAAIRNVEVYYATLTSEKQAKWAVNYLKDRSFIIAQK